MLFIFSFCGILITISTLYAAFLAIQSTVVIHKEDKRYYEQKRETLKEVNELLNRIKNDPNSTKTTEAVKELVRYLKKY